MRPQLDILGTLHEGIPAASIMQQEVTTYYVEITDRAEIKPARAPQGDVEIRQARLPLPELNRMLFVAVGRDYQWRARLAWSRERWLEYMGRPNLETWVIYLDGTPVGYYEQDLPDGANAEIVNFGLIPPFTGRGLGGHLLVHAIERGFDRGARRVWLHTCTQDHPHALAHYLARGLKLYDTVVDVKQIDAGPQKWPEL